MFMTRTSPLFVTWSALSWSALSLRDATRQVYRLTKEAVLNAVLILR
jgi:hypothetical protein